MTQTHQLLRDYIERASESAFRQLVDQYIDLVFSTALRRLAGDRHRAEDATQIVFTDLARKAGSLPPNVMLGGWLHRHCCFVASSLTRAETRRTAREQQAAAMQTLHPHNDANWTEIAPELDRAIDSLEPEDRDAIILRFFESRNFKAIGEAIGATENAAQKRVTRAIEKLRELLGQRGVALSAAALITTLSTQAITNAPAALATKTTAGALKHTAAKVAATAGATSAVAVAVWLLLAAAIVTAIGVVVVKTKTNEPPAAQPTDNGAATAKNSATSAAKTPQLDQNNSAPTNATTQAPHNGPVLRLTILAADTGNPVPNVPIEYRATENKRWVDKDLSASRAGIAVIPFTANTTELRLTMRTEGFADTRLFWKPADGAAIPTEYTLRLKRGVPIGGKVVNSSGQLVPGAAIDFNMPIPDANMAQKTENHEIEAIHIVAEDGNWETSRLPDSLLRRMHASASHPDYAGSEDPTYPTPSDTVDLLLKRKHVFVMRDGLSVRGIVVNKSDEPIPGAKILVGGIDMSGSKNGVANSEGKFEILGCPPAPTTVTASAEGYAAVTLPVKSPTPEEGYRLVLEPGRILKMKITTSAGEPIPKTSARLLTVDNRPDNMSKPPLVQVEFTGKSDAEGKIQWDQAPAGDLVFDIYAAGYMSRNLVTVTADGSEHIITLVPALKVTGIVRDAMSSAPIPKFRVIPGWPQTFTFRGHKQQYFWSQFERDWIYGSNGRFEKTLDHSVVYGVDKNRYAFKVEADGYKPFVTRIINEDEANVELDIALQRGGVTTLTILSPDGQPSPDTDVAFPSEFGRVHLGGRGILRDGGIGKVVLTDSKGQTTLPSDDPAKIVAAGPAGFAMINVADLPTDGAIRLQPWARVEGRITRRGKPLADWKLHIGADTQRDHISLQAGDTVTDSDGRFTVQYAPPGQMKLVRIVPSGEPNTFAHSPIRDVQIIAGETANADYEQQGVVANVRLRWPAGFTRTPEHRIFCGAHVPYPKPTREELADPAVLARWRERPDVKPVLAKMRGAQFLETEGAVWSTENLEPGDWLVTVNVIEQKPNPPVGQPLASLLTGSLKIQIPENPTEEKFDLGEIILAPPPVTQ